MSVTLSSLRTTFYDILRNEENTSAYPYTLVDLLLNSSQQRICSGSVMNPLTKETVTKGQLPFLFTDQYYSNVATTDLTADTTVGAVTLSVTDASDFPATGVLYIAGNIITYTGTTATSFTGVAGVLFAFESGTEVSIAFTLPTDFMSPINLVYNNRLKLEQKLYDDIYEDLNKYKGNYYQRNKSRTIYDDPYKAPPFYTIKDGSYLILFNFNQTDDIIKLRYEKLPTTLSLTTDTATIDNDIYARTTIPYLAVGEMLYNRGEEQRAAEILNFAIGQIKECYKYYNDKTYERISGTQYKTAKGRINI